MSRRHIGVSRTERFASLVVAVAATVGAGLLMMLAPGNGFIAAFKARRTPAPAADRVVYVTPPRAAAPFPSIARVQASPRARPAVQTPTVVGSDVIETNANRTDTATARPNPTRISPTIAPTPPSARVPAGAPATSAVVGFTLPSAPVKFDSAIAAVNKQFKEGLASGLLKPPPPTQDEIDAKLRAEALEAIAARGAGVPVRTVMVGTGVPVGLPGGGPSNKQRARDRAIFAELQKVVALRQQKAESLAAVRKRRVDSLAQLADSGKRRQNPNY